MGRFIVAAAVLVLFAAGCGNDNVTVSVAPETTDAPTQSTVPDVAPETTAPAQELSAADLLAAAFESTAASAVRGQLRIEGEMVDADESPSVDFTMDAQGDTEARLSVSDDPSEPQLTVRVVNGQMYTGFPGELAAQTVPGFAADHAWFSVSGPSADQFAVACASPLAQIGEPSGVCDPAGDLRRLADAAQEPAVVGREELRGIPVRQLRFEASLENLPSAATDFGASDDVVAMEPVEGVTIDVWIDDQTLLRRLVVDLSSIIGGFAGVFAGDDADIGMPTWRVVVDYLDFDEAISIETPSEESLLGDFSDMQDFG